jgi:hypothetical protein
MEVETNSCLFSVNGRDVEARAVIMFSKNILGFLGLGVADKKTM